MSGSVYYCQGTLIASGKLVDAPIPIRLDDIRGSRSIDFPQTARGVDRDRIRRESNSWALTWSVYSFYLYPVFDLDRTIFRVKSLQFDMSLAVACIVPIGPTADTGEKWTRHTGEWMIVQTIDAYSDDLEKIQPQSGHIIYSTCALE